jgi:hypothetical protein
VSWSDGRLAWLYLVDADVDGGQKGGAEVLLTPTWGADQRMTGWEGWSFGHMTSECDDSPDSEYKCDFTRHWTCRGT